jgi:cell division protein FtsL
MTDKTTPNTFQTIRDQKIKSITDAYYNILSQYVTTYNLYLGADESSKQEYQIKLKDLNTQLFNIATKLKKNNDAVKDTANYTFSQFNFDTDKIKTITEVVNDLQNRQTDYTSISNLTEQVQQLTRYENKIFWIRLILIILLAFSIFYVLTVIKHDEKSTFFAFMDNVGTFYK